MLEGIRVIDLTGESGALAARALADLGATVTRPEPPDGGHFSRQPHRHAAWTARTTVEPMDADDPALDALLAQADVVLATRGHGIEVGRASRAVWVHVSPFGLTGPRARWRAGDLGILASTGNLFATGDPDRAPVRCAEPLAFAHVGPEAAFAALTGLFTGRPQQVDVSVQEAVMIASMGAGGRFARHPDRGRRTGRGARPGGRGTTDPVSLPVNSPRQLLDSEQLNARGFFGPLAGVERAPLGFVHVHDGPEPPEPPSPPPVPPPVTRDTFGGSVGAWTGTRILEFGGGAVAAIATRYFAEHGADVIRIEDPRRPDVLRGDGGADADVADRLERSALFDALNPDKRSIAIDLEQPAGRALTIELLHASDAVTESLPPKDLAALGLGYPDLVAHVPDLVMLSVGLHGQTGPRRDQTGDDQGPALAGFDGLTGWPDREPVEPFGTVTDSLAARFSAAALAAALLRRRRTGRGTYLDLSQVEAGVHALSPWLVEYQVTGEARDRMGNRADRYAPHGVFPCAGEERWIVIAVYTEPEWAVFAGESGLARPGWADVRGRLADLDALEAAVADWTAGLEAIELATRLQGLGVEAVPVADFGDVSEDPQLRARGHYVALDHPVLGPGEYERNGIRVSGAPCGYLSPSPLLGQHTDEVLTEILGLETAEVARLRETGVVG